MAKLIKLENSIIGSDSHDDDNERESGVATKSLVQLPAMYRVLLLNDDFTPMDFVVDILESIFHKNHTQATKIMMNVHRKGVGECGVYTRDVAETKVMQVSDKAKNSNYPLQCTMERA